MRGLWDTIGPAAAKRGALGAALLLLLFLMLIALGVGRGLEKNDPVYTGFNNEQRVVLQGYDGDAMEPFLTRDGRFLFFNNRNEAPQNTNIHYAERIGDLHFRYRGEIAGVNTPALEGVPSMDAQGRFYFVSNRSYDTTFSTIYRGTFRNGVVSGVEIVPGVSRRQPGIVNFDAEISADGRTLYFVDGDFTGEPKPKSSVMVTAHRAGDRFVRDPQSAMLLKSVNAAGISYAPDIANDGLELFFTRIAKLDGTVLPSIFRAARTRRDQPFGMPQRVGGITGFVEGPTISSDGRRLYYHKRVNDRFVIFMVTRKRGM